MCLDISVAKTYFEKDKLKYTHNTPHTKEALYYRQIFEKHFNGYSNVIPHFWMPNPKWCNVSDPSARILKNYDT